MRKKLQAANVRRVISRLILATERITILDSPHAYALAFVLLAVSLCLVGVVILVTGPAVQNLYGHDDMLFLEGAWKVLHGFRPHVDFYSPFTALVYLLPALGMVVYGSPDAYGIVIGNLLLCVVAVLVGWQVCKPRFSALICFAFLFFVASVVFRAHHLRYDYMDTSYAGLYNRQCYALTALLLPVLFVPRRIWSARGEWWDSLAIGAILAVLGFIKISFLFATILPVLMGFAFVKSFRVRLVGIIAGFFIITIPLLAYLQFDLVSIYRDLSMAGSVRGSTIPFAQAVKTVDALAGIFGVLFPMRGLTQIVVKDDAFDGITTEGWKQLLALLSIGLTAIMIVITNSPLGKRVDDVPLLVAASFLFMEVSVRRFKCVNPEASGISRNSWIFAIILVLGCALLWAPISENFKSIAYAYRIRLSESSHASVFEHFQSASLASLVVRGYGGDPAMPVTYAQKVNDGLDLLRRETPPNSRVSSFGFTNPFPFGLLWPPTSGGPTFWHFGFSFSRTAFPPAEKVFRDTDVIMIPKFPGDPNSTQMLLEIYRNYLSLHFEKTAESSYWILLSEKGAQ